MSDTPLVTRVRRRLRGLPVVGPALGRVWRRLGGTPDTHFDGSASYRERRYATGGNSGAGSYDALAVFKAEVLNAFVEEHGVTDVIEFGCGDGNQLELATYPAYVGYDVSSRAVGLCRERFAGDDTRRFALTSDYRGETAELTLSLDVIFHLVEDEVFDDYMARLFDASSRWVIVYSSDTDEQRDGVAPHVRHRAFSRWVAQHRPGFRLVQHIPNRHPWAGDPTTGSFADFYVFEKVDAG